MAKYRIVHTEFWRDTKVIEEMTPEDKYFFLYLLTNPVATQVGIYQITKKQIAFDIGYSPEAVNALFDRFINHHELIRYNKETRELAIKNWGRYNFIRGGKPVIDCVKKELEEVKDKSMIPFVGDNVTNAEIRQIYDYYKASESMYMEPSKIYKPEPDEVITAPKYVLWRDRQTCFYTGITLQKKDIQIDHIVPKRLGGDGYPENLVVSYSKFNNLKSGNDNLEDVIAEWNRMHPDIPIDYRETVAKIEALKEFEKLRAELKITYRQTINNDIYDTDTIRKYMNTIRGQKEKEKEKEKEKQQQTVQQPNNAHSFYEANLGPLSPFIIDDITEWCNDLNDDLVIESMKKALEANAMNKWVYSKKILKSWKEQNVKSLTDIAWLEKNRKNVVSFGRQQLEYDATRDAF